MQMPAVLFARFPRARCMAEPPILDTARTTIARRLGLVRLASVCFLSGEERKHRAGSRAMDLEVWKGGQRRLRGRLSVENHGLARGKSRRCHGGGVREVCSGASQ